MVNPSDNQQPTASLGDTDPMPFGKFKGKPMQDVPANYLHWLWVNGKQHEKDCPVHKYIEENMTILQQEYQDGIW